MALFGRRVTAGFFRKPKKMEIEITAEDIVRNFNREFGG